LEAHNFWNPDAYPDKSDKILTPPSGHKCSLHRVLHIYSGVLRLNRKARRRFWPAINTRQYMENLKLSSFPSPDTELRGGCKHTESASTSSAITQRASVSRSSRHSAPPTAVSKTLSLELFVLHLVGCRALTSAHTPQSTSTSQGFLVGHTDSMLICDLVLRQKHLRN